MTPPDEAVRLVLPQGTEPGTRPEYIVDPDGIDPVEGLPRAVFDYLIKNPEAHDQSLWAHFGTAYSVLMPSPEPVHCGTTMCIAGAACHLAGYALMQGRNRAVFAYRHGDKTGIGYDVEQLGAVLLDLPEDEAGVLFETMNEAYALGRLDLLAERGTIRFATSDGSPQVADDAIALMERYPGAVDQCMRGAYDAPLGVTLRPGQEPGDGMQFTVLGAVALAAGYTLLDRFTVVKHDPDNPVPETGADEAVPDAARVPVNLLVQDRLGVCAGDVNALDWETEVEQAIFRLNSLVRF